MTEGGDARRGAGLARAVGIAVVLLALVSGARDLGFGLENWDSYTPVTPGDPLPTFTATLEDGAPFTPTQLEGQVSLLTFWATWCHACGLEMPTIDAVARHYRDAGVNVQVYGINRDSGEPAARRELVESYLAEREFDVPQVYDDGQIARAFGVEQIPYLVIVDTNGRIRHLHLGQVREGTLRGEIDALLDE